MVLASNDFPGTSGNPYQPTFWQSHRLKVDLMGRTDASNAPRTIRVERVYIVDAIGYEQRVGWGLWVDYTLKYIRCANILSDGVEFDRVIQNLTIHGDPQQTEQVLQLAHQFGAADWATIKERVMRAVDGINNQIWKWMFAFLPWGSIIPFQAASLVFNRFNLSIKIDDTSAAGFNLPETSQFTYAEGVRPCR